MLKIFATYQSLTPEHLDERVGSQDERDILSKALRAGLQDCFQDLGYEVSEDEASIWHARWLDSPRPIVSFHISETINSHRFGGISTPYDDLVVIEASPWHQESVSELSYSLSSLGFTTSSGKAAEWRKSVKGSEFIEFLMPPTSSKKARQELIRRTASLLTTLGYDGYEWATKWTAKSKRT